MSEFLDYVYKEIQKKDKVEMDDSTKKKKAKEWVETKILPNLSKCTLATHVGKFTHPSCKVNMCYLKKVGQNGYVMTGNSKWESDIICGSAAFMPAAKLLIQELSDGKNMLSHIEKRDPTLINDCRSLSVDFDEIEKAVQGLTFKEIPKETSKLLKQVYFPIGNDDYHLLTVMPASSLLMAMRKHIIDDGEQRKKSRDKKDEAYGEDYGDIPRKTKIKIGGTKPQNISILNNRYGGLFYLLESLPPSMTMKRIALPKRDLFTEIIPYLWPYESYQALFWSLHRVFRDERNNGALRKRRKERVEDIIDLFLEATWMIRKQGKGWSDEENYRNLPAEQKIWIDDKYKEERKKGDFIEILAGAWSRWCIREYERIIKKGKDNPVILGDAEQLAFAQEFKEIIKEEVRENP